MKISARTALELISAGLLLIAVAWLWIDRDDARADSARNEAGWQAEKAAHKQTEANHRAAAAEAARRDAENRARIEAEQRAANERISHDYESRLAAVRARYEQLLRERARAGNSGAGSAAVPARPGAAPSVDGAAGDHGLSLRERLIATETAVRLEELQRWVLETLAIVNSQPEN